jgi:hypothetical protein
MGISAWPQSGFKRTHKKGFKTEVLKPLMSELSVKLSQKIFNGIAAVNGVCRA